MNLPRIREGEWFIEKLDSYPFELLASYMENGERISICADDSRLEIFSESLDRRYPLSPSINYEIDDEVREDDLIQLLKDIRTTVSKIQGSLKESSSRRFFIDGMKRVVDRFVESTNDGRTFLKVLNETGSAHQSNRLADFSLDHYVDTYGDQEYWSILVQFKGSFGREISKLIGIGERIVSEPIYNQRDAKRILSGKFSEFKSIFGDRPTMPKAIEAMKSDSEYYEEVLSNLFYNFSFAGR